MPHIKVEQRLMAEETDVVIGVDEVGRGPLAGPVVAGAAWINPELYNKDFEGRELIRDSKLLSEYQREKIGGFIEESKDFVFGIGEVSERMIDRMNILRATFLAMRLAVEDLADKLSEEGKIILLVDGNKKIPRVNHEQKIFPKGDQNIFSIAAASICAKVHRDGIMQQYHNQYPEYGFDAHKGYGTRFHMEQLEKYGPCKIHRKCFGPVKELF